MIQDIRYCLRSMRRNPGFTAAIVLTMALSLGANTAIFSVVDAVLLRPLPYGDASRLVSVYLDDFSGRMFEDFRAHSNSFELLAATSSQDLTLTGVEHPEVVRAQFVSIEFFRLLGIEPVVGRTFLPEDGRGEGSRAVVISHGVWQRQFGGRRDIVGRPVTLGDRPYAIVGVLPPHFVDLTTGPARQAPPQVWIPITAYTGAYYSILGRLKPGVSLDQARQESEALNRSLTPRLSFYSTRQRVVSVEEELVAAVRPRLILLLGAVGFVLFIGCANIASMLMASGAARRSELAVRSALGAERRRIVRLLLTESVVLAVFGGALGILVAMWGLHGLLSLVPTDLPRGENIAIDLRVLGFTSALSVVTGLLFGLAPALRLSQPGAAISLHPGACAAGRGRRRNRFGGTLIAAEIAVTVVLLAGAVLMIRSFWLAMRVAWGFRPESVLAVDVVLPQKYRDGQQIIGFHREALRRFQSLSGIESAAVARDRPLGGEAFVLARAFTIEGATGEREKPALWNPVSPDYFRALRIPLLKGRLLTDNDVADPRAVVISEAMAREYFRDRNPIGVHIRETRNRGARWLEVVGVVGAVKGNLRHDLQHGRRLPVIPEVYEPYSADRGFLRNASFVFRSRLQPAQLAAMVRAELRALDPEVVERRTTTMEQAISEAGAQPRFYTTMLAVFALMALTIAAMGIYGLIHYSVSGRTHEFGIRMAVGAGRDAILRLVLRQGATVTACGVAVGLLGAWGATRLLRSWLFEIKPTDPAAFAAACGILTAVALAACYVPARRAAGIDPLEALRHE